MITSLSTFFSMLITTFLGVLFAFIHFFLPLTPTCELTIHTPESDTTTMGEGTAHIQQGEAVQISWKSTNASTAVVNDAMVNALSGTDSFAPSATTTYTYSFSAGKKEVLCSVVVGVTKTPEVLPVISLTPKPVVPVVVPPKAIPPVSPPIKIPPPVVPTSTPEVVPIGPTTLVVWNIPLLSGGTVKGGQTVPVSYLQITNTGKASTVLKGFWVTQTGTAPPSTVIGLSTVDDRGGSRGSAGGTEGNSPFNGFVALAPTDAHFEPGQLRLFTIKARITTQTDSLIGTTVTLVVSGVETEAEGSGAFPIHGTTWTISH